MTATFEHSSSIKKTQLLFVSICLYLLSHSFMIPIRAIGPSWSLWPTMADILSIPLLGVAVLGFRSKRSMTRHHRLLLRSIGLLLIIASLGMVQTFLSTDGRESVMYGGYFLYRFFQFYGIFWAVSQMAWTPRRLATLRWVIDAVLLITFAGVILTFLGIIPLGSLVAHLPQSNQLSGPWMFYPLKERYPEEGRGIGFVGYNHAYAGVQILALTALRFALSRSRVGVVSAALVVVALIASFFTESRAGFAALLFFAATQFFRSPRLILLCLPIGMLALVLIGGGASDVSDTMRRQQTILAATQDDNLSGRPFIWDTYTTYLLEHPLAIVVGAGLGSSYPVTINRSCHMTPLQYLFELGIIGVAVYGFIVFQVGLFLYRHESGTKPLFFALVALQVASLTMETFYPIPYLGHFLALCLITAAVAFSVGSAQKQESAVAL